MKYPGRLGRQTAPLLQTAHGIVDSLLKDVIVHTNTPLILGFSLGAYSAYETSLTLEELGLHSPAELVVAAARPPHLPAGKSPVSSLGRSEFVARL